MVSHNRSVFGNFLGENCTQSRLVIYNNAAEVIARAPDHLMINCKMYQIPASGNVIDRNDLNPKKKRKYDDRPLQRLTDEVTAIRTSSPT